MEQKVEHYDESDIQVLEGLEAVRKRPGMYIGTTSARGLHHLVWEIVDNSIDEALAGFCNKIRVVLLPGDVVKVIDNGRGMPTGMNVKTGLPNRQKGAISEIDYDLDIPMQNSIVVQNYTT